MIPATKVPNRKLVAGRRDRSPVVVRGHGFDEIASGPGAHFKKVALLTARLWRGCEGKPVASVIPWGPFPAVRTSLRAYPAAATTTTPHRPRPLRYHSSRDSRHS